MSDAQDLSDVVLCVVDVLSDTMAMYKGNQLVYLLSGAIMRTRASSKHTALYASFPSYWTASDMLIDAFEWSEIFGSEKYSTPHVHTNAST